MRSSTRPSGDARVDLRARLRVIVVTNPEPTGGSLEHVVGEVLSVGVRAVQLRDKEADASTLLRQTRRLLALTRPAGALLFVNDRVDVALAAGADGVHVGADDPPVRAIRAAVPDHFLIGFSADDPGTARRAEEAGADYIGCGAVFGTRTKDVGEEAIGVERLDLVARSVGIPVVGIGGITLDGAGRIARESSATGVAVVSEVMAADDPARVATDLLAAVDRARRYEVGGRTNAPGRP